VNLSGVSSCYKLQRLNLLVTQNKTMVTRDRLTIDKSLRRGVHGRWVTVGLRCGRRRPSSAYGARWTI